MFTATVFGACLNHHHHFRKINNQFNGNNQKTNIHPVMSLRSRHSASWFNTRLDQETSARNEAIYKYGRESGTEDVYRGVATT